MSGRSHLTSEAANILSLGLKLGKEIWDMIVDTVTRHATDIENFVARKEDLLKVDTRFLWFFAIAVELDFASSTWQDQKTRDVIDEIARIASHDFQFTSSSLKTESELASERESIRTNLSQMHENLQKNWNVLRKRTVPDRKDDAIFYFVLYYLRRAYPPIGSFLYTDNLTLFASLHRQFGLKMIPPQFQQPDPARIDPLSPS